MSGNGAFVVEDECHKNQQTLLPVPWTGRTIIEETCDEFEGHLMYLTKSEESLIKNPVSKRGEVQKASWSSPGSWHRKQALKRRDTECFRKKRVLIFERLLSDTCSLRNRDGSRLTLSLFILLMCAVVRIFPSKINRWRVTCANH